MKNSEKMDFILESLESTIKLSRAAAMAADFLSQSGASTESVEAIQELLNIQSEKLEATKKFIYEEVFGYNKEEVKVG
jgi:hypothetical protein